MNHTPIYYTKKYQPNYRLQKIERSIYCEIEFLNKIQPLLEQQKNPMEWTEQDVYLYQLVQMLVRFNLYLNIAEDKIRYYSNLTNISKNNTVGLDKILYTLFMRRKESTSSKVRGNNCFVSIRRISEKSSAEQLNSIYLTCEPSEICKEIERKYGVFCVRYDETKGFITPYAWLRPALIDKLITKRKPSNDWGFLQELQIKSNSLIIVDGYLLQNTDKIKLNVECILNRILPKESMSIPFHITIISNEQTEENKLKLQDARQIINQIITRIRDAEYNYSLNICNMRGLEHDRYLITNNIFMISPAGFDLIKIENDKKIYKNSTTIHASSIYSNNSDRKNYDELCRRLMNMRDNCKWWDNNENRLIL